MKIYEQKQKLEDFWLKEDGITLDFENNTFLIIHKDTNLHKDEIQSFRKKPLHISFFAKKGVSMLIVDVEDYLSDSSLPFNMADAPRELIETLNQEEAIAWQFLLLDANDSVVSERHGAFSKENSRHLKQRLLQLYEHPLDNYDEMLEGLLTNSDVVLQGEAEFTEEFAK